MAAGSKAYREQWDALEEIRRGLDLEYPVSIPPGTRMPRPRDADLLVSMRTAAAELLAEEHRNLVQSGKLRDALEEALTFAGLSIPFKDIDQLSFLTVRIGRVQDEKLENLKASVGERAVVISVGARGAIVAVATRSGRFLLDAELAKAGFEPRKFSPDFRGVPPELPAALEQDLRRLESERAELWMRKSELRSRMAGPWKRIAASYAVASSIEEAKGSIRRSSAVCTLEGWVPETEIQTLARALERHVPGRVALRSFEPGEVEGVASGAEDVPIVLRNPPLVSSFERMVTAFGLPAYGSIDPTPFVSFFFILLFSIMFGDVGQGFLIFLSAAAIHFGWLPKLSRWKQFAPIGMAAGVGSMIMGFLTGSVFTFEDLLVPLTRSISLALFGTGVDRFLTLLPSEGPERAAAFFGFTLALGSVVNSTGLILNIVNKLRRGNISEAVFSKTGIAGTLFFWWSLGIGLRSMLGMRPAWFDAIGLGLPLVLLMFEEQLHHTVDEMQRRNRCRSAGAGRLSGEAAAPEQGDGVFAAAVKAFVALLESVSFYLSGTFSFLRVGAFALSHVVLSFIVFELGEMLGHGSPAGIIGRIAVVLIGNAIILLLEGLVVVVQVVRLQYYEFMSKFLTENGSPFDPFKFSFRKEFS
jgi:V/A-type H+-transporting ATPase subunit I